MSYEKITFGLDVLKWIEKKMIFTVDIIRLHYSATDT